MKKREVPQAGELYLHFKNKLYQVIVVAEHTETKEKMVVYQALYGTYEYYVRPLEMFLSPVDVQKYPNTKQNYRFEKLDRSLLKKENDIQIENMGQKEEKIKESTLKEEKIKENEINKDLLLFLEAEGYEDKLVVFQMIKSRLDDNVLQSIAMSLDCNLPEGKREEQIEAVVYFLETHIKYEGKRLR